MRLVKISDLADISPSRKKTTRNPSDLTPFVPMECVDENKGVIAEVYNVPFEKVSKGYTYFENGDIIFAKITPCMENGKSAIVENLKGGFGFGSTEFIVIRPKKDIYRNLLYQFMRSKDFRDDAKDHFTGSAGQQRVPSSFVKDALIPIPDDDKDIPNIISLLEEKIAHIQAMRQAALKQKEAAKALQSAVLRDMFPWQAGESLPKGWQWEKIRSFATVIRGASPRPKGSPFFFGGPFPRLMVADVTRDGMYVTPKIDSLTEEGAKRSRPMKAGNLVIQVSGNPGTPSILKIDCCIHDGFAGLVGIDENKYHIPYIYFYLETVKDISSKDASGGIWENLDTTKIKELSIPFPETRELQEEITNRVFDKMEHMTKLLNSCNIQLAAIDVLSAASLREAFNFGIKEN